MKKKSQLTMIMLLGLVLFVLVSLALYLSKSALNKKEKIERVQENFLEAQPIKDYIQKCLDSAGTTALNLLGQQGGYIYTSQGGNLVDFSSTDEGLMFTKNGEYKVAYSILPLRSNIGQYFFQAPKYPWITFPYPDENSGMANFKGHFGTARLPPLTSSQGQESIQTQMENYIEKAISRCSLEGFSEHGYSIMVEKPKASVAIGDRDVSIKLNYPVHVSGASQQSFDISEFSSKIDVRMRNLYFFVKGLIEQDTNNIVFDIGKNSNNKDGFIINVLRNNFRNDDIVMVTDTKSYINGKPFQYIFSRKNMAPALYYIKNNELQFEPNHLITEEDLSQGASFRMAADPDEDQLTYIIRVFDEEVSFPVSLDKEQIDFVIEVSDGQLSDFQIIKVKEISE